MTTTTIPKFPAFFTDDKMRGYSCSWCGSERPCACNGKRRCAYCRALVDFSNRECWCYGRRIAAKHTGLRALANLDRTSDGPFCAPRRSHDQTKKPAPATSRQPPDHRLGVFRSQDRFNGMRELRELRVIPTDTDDLDLDLDQGS